MQVQILLEKKYLKSKFIFILTPPILNIPKNFPFGNYDCELMYVIVRAF